MSAIRRQLNRFKEEGPLKNVLLEMKHTSKTIHSVASAQSRLLTEIEKWADKQSQPIDDFAKGMQVPELDIVAYIQQYLSAYEEFRGFWHDILTERKEFKSAIHAHHKMEKAVSSAQKQAKSTKLKEERRQRRESRQREGNGGSTTDSEGSTGSTPTHSPTAQRKSLQLDMVEGELAAKRHAEEESMEKLKERQLSIEKRVHHDLRKAYDVLLKQRMEFLHNCAESVHRMCEVLETLPDVESIAGGDEEHPTFLYKPFHEKPEAAGTVWWKGRTYRDALEAEKEASRNAVEAEQSSHKEEVQRLRHMWQQEKTSLKEQLRKVQQEHQKLLETFDSTTEESELSLQDAHKRIAVLSSKLASTEETASRLIIDDVKGVLASTESTLNADVLTAALSDITATTFLAQELSSPRGKAEIERKLVAVVRQYAVAMRACQGSLSELTMEDAAKCQEALKPVATAMGVFVSDAHTHLDKLGNEEGSYARVSEANVDSVCSNLSKVYKLLEEADHERKNVPRQLTEKVSRAQEAVRDALSSMHDLESLVSDEDPHVQQSNQEILEAATAVLESVQAFITTADELKKLVTRNKDDTGFGVLHAHRWFGALETVVNAVLSNLPVWLECLRRFLSDGSQFERLQVAVRGLSACSAQLIALIRTTRAYEDQATRETMETIVGDSRSLTARSHDLIDALRAVKNVSLARSMIDDPSNMNDVQVKRMVMDSQVEVLRLEQALDDERDKLAKFRRALAEQSDASRSNSDHEGAT